MMEDQSRHNEAKRIKFFQNRSKLEKVHKDTFQTGTEKGKEVQS
jgi:hypothetical protein